MISVYSEVWPFKTTLCLRFQSFLKVKLVHHERHVNALEISKKTPLT